MAKIRKRFLKYTTVLGRRIYNPIKPLVSPLLSKIKLIHVLVGFLILGLGGSLWNGWRVTGKERVAWWPWSAKSHGEMAIAWFEDGNEKMAIKELELANRLVIWETEGVENSLKRAEDKVGQLAKIRQEIESWEKILSDKPFYRDVLLRLALLNYQVLEDERAKEYWERANYLDPNNQEVQQVGDVIFSL